MHGVKPSGTPYFNSLPYKEGRPDNAQTLLQQLNAAAGEDTARGLGHTRQGIGAAELDVPRVGSDGIKAGLDHC